MFQNRKPENGMEGTIWRTLNVSKGKNFQFSVLFLLAEKDESLKRSEVSNMTSIWHHSLFILLRADPYTILFGRAFGSIYTQQRLWNQLLSMIYIYFLILIYHSIFSVFITFFNIYSISINREIPDLFRVLNMISHEWAQRTSEISCSTREINLVFPSAHVFFCLLYKRQSLKSDNFYRKAIIEKR
jgi:hypothetical protein